VSIHVLGIVGSLRKASFNNALMHAAAELVPAGMEIEIYPGLGDIPMFNEDVEALGDPEPVRTFKAAIQSADALLFATPEYNFGLPGVLKNAVDWASRPPRKCVLNGKPAAIIGATPGGLGTSRAQMQLRQSFVFTQTNALLQPEVLVAKAHEKFDAQGRLIDEGTRKNLQKLLQALSEWVVRLRGA
jgi:chromate reductase